MNLLLYLLKKQHSYNKNILCLFVDIILEYNMLNIHTRHLIRGEYHYIVKPNYSNILSRLLHMF